jgi:hypothetical protein
VPGSPRKRPFGAVILRFFGPVIRGFQIVYSYNPGSDRQFCPKDIRRAFEFGLPRDLSPLFGLDIPTTGMRSLQQLLEQCDCLENCSAPLFLLRLAVPKLGSGTGKPVWELHSTAPLLCWGAIIRPLYGRTERAYPEIEIPQQKEPRRSLNAALGRGLLGFMEKRGF